MWSLLRLIQLFIKTRTSLPINLYHKQYTFTHKWSLSKLLLYLLLRFLATRPLKNFLNEGLRSGGETYPLGNAWLCGLNTLMGSVSIQLLAMLRQLFACLPYLLDQTSLSFSSCTSMHAEWSKHCSWIVVAVGVTNMWVVRAHTKNHHELSKQHSKQRSKPISNNQ